jgi:hypothetical protein
MKFGSTPANDRMSVKLVFESTIMLATKSVQFGPVSRKSYDTRPARAS